MTDKDRMLIANAILIPDGLKSIEEAEFSVFSQFGDDGIIQYLVKHTQLRSDFFVEFGVEDYRESNTRYLLMNNNWSGFVMDGSKANIDKITSSDYYWKYDLQALQQFVTAENITSVLKQYCPAEIGLLHIDIDGMDYWIWQAISKEILPDIVVLEYNSLFGPKRAITVPYTSDFQRLKAHYSGLYAGASIGAMCQLSNQMGYTFMGSNSAGNNAYFIRNELLNEHHPTPSLENGIRNSKFRESRDKYGKLSYLRDSERLAEIRTMPIFNTTTSQIESV